MSDISVRIIAGVVLFIYLSFIAIQYALNAQRAKTMKPIVETLLSAAESLLPKKEHTIEPFPEEIQDTLLEQFKKSKRVILKVNGDTVTDLSLQEFEDLCLLNGHDCEGPIVFNVGSGEPDAEKESSIIQFPEN